MVYFLHEITTILGGYVYYMSILGGYFVFWMQSLIITITNNFWGSPRIKL